MAEFNLSNIKLIVGLGNIGIDYKNTRHNAGFTFLDTLVTEDFNLEEKFHGYIAKSDSELTRNPKLLLKPNTMMNLSGRAVVALSKYYNYTAEEILVVYDDLDLRLGEFKLQFNKNPHDHNGVNNIIQMLGTNAFWNLRIGVDNRTPEERKLIDGYRYVLAKFSKEESEILNQTFDTITKRLNGLNV